MIFVANQFYAHWLEARMLGYRRRNLRTLWLRRGHNSWTSASNSKSSSSISIKSSFLIIPHFSKQFFIVVPVTSFHASWAHRMAISMFTSLIICVAEEYSLILASTYLTSLFLYFTLKFWIILASSGWKLKDVFLGRKIIFIYKNESIIDFGWHVALSRIKTTFLCSSNSFLLKRVSTACITSDVIHDFGLEK